MQSEPAGLQLYSSSTHRPRHNNAVHEDYAADATAPRSRFDATAMLRIDTNDPDEFCHLLSEWDVKFTQLRSSSGPFSGRAQVIPLGAVLIVSGHLNKSMLQTETLPKGCITVCRPGRGSAPLSYLGHEVEDSEVFVAGPDAEGEVVNRGVHYPTTISMALGIWEDASDWLTPSNLLTDIRGVRLHEAGRAWTASFLDAMTWVIDAVNRYPEATTRVDIRDSLADQLLSRVNTVGAADAPVLKDRQMRAHRRVAVERARDYIAHNLTDPIRLSDLSKYAHTQARSLEYGFREVLGVSPMTYVRTTRLHRARRLLRTTAVHTRSISEVALDCGFWHLSQFAVDYKRLFGESPSVTFRRTEAELPRSERRRNEAMKAPLHPAAVSLRSILGNALS